MDLHEEFRELCAAATAGELSVDEQARLDAHLATCAGCRRVYREFELAAIKGAGALAGVHGLTHEESLDPSWSVEKAEEAFFKRLDEEERKSRIDVVRKDASDHVATGKRFTYRPSQIRWREIWMSFAAAILLALALGVAAYKSGVRRGADVAQTRPQPAKESEGSLEAQVSDAGYERSQLQGKLAADAKVIEDLKLQLAEQIRIVNSVKSMETVAAHKTKGNQQPTKGQGDANDRRDEELTAAQARLSELQKTVDVATAQRDENARQAAVLEAKVNELTALVREREQALDRTESEVTKGQELLEHDRDIRELMGARDLYMADVHDVPVKEQKRPTAACFIRKGSD